MTIRSIRAKLILGIVALLLVSTGALAVVTIQQTQSGLNEEIVATHAARAETHAVRLQGLVDGLRDRALDAVTAPPFLDDYSNTTRESASVVGPQDEPARRDILRERILPDRLVQDALLVDADGRLVLVEPVQIQGRVAAETANTESSEHLRVLAAIARGAESPLVTQSLEPGSWSVTAPLRTSNGSLYGALILRGHPLDELPTLLLPDTGPSTDRYLFDVHGQLIIGPGRGQDTDQAADDDTTTLAMRFGPALQPGVRSATVQIGPTPHLATAAAVEGTPWTLVLATNEAVIFAPVDRLVRDSIGVLIASLFGGTIVAIALARHVVEPVRRIQAGARRVTEGEYGTQVRVNTRDELSDLAGAFNAMSARLHEEHLALVNHRDRLERTVEERTAALLEKNAELETFVYAVSHDLKTPLVSLDWLAEELAEELEEAGQQKEDVAQIITRMRTNVAHMGRLIGNLLELSRIGKGSLAQERIPLDALIAQVVEEHISSINDRAIDISRDPRPLPTLVADPTYMHQLMSNLLGNAIKYGDQEDLKITIRAQPEGGDVEDAPRWRFEIEDNGPGIPEEHREAVFQLFTRAPDAAGRAIPGTGVGLAIARKIVRTYGGELKVATGRDGGACFWFTMPSRYLAADRVHDQPSTREATTRTPPDPRT